MGLLSHLLHRFVRNGHLLVTDYAGRTYSFGIAGSAPRVAIHLTDKAVEREIFLNPELKTAEAYMDERLVMKDDTRVFDLLYLFSINRTGLAAHPVQQVLRQLWRAMRHGQQRNPLGIAARNIRHHYDIPADFFRLWLDETMTYSCGYYITPDISLRQAQIDKMRRVAAKLKLEPKMHVAEIGSGYGALATFMARNYNVRVTSVSLSSEQIGVAKARAMQEGVDDRVAFVEQDLSDIGRNLRSRCLNCNDGSYWSCGVRHVFYPHQAAHEAGGLRTGALHRPHVPSRNDCTIPSQIYLPGWVRTCAIGGVCLLGADRHLVRRLREFAHALLLDNQAVARGLRRPPYRSCHAHG